jgi:hypothetical protein
MRKKARKDMFSRRGFLGMGSVALAAASMLSAAETAAQEQNRLLCQSQRRQPPKTRKTKQPRMIPPQQNCSESYQVRATFCAAEY